MLEEKLINLKKELVIYAGLVEGMVEKSVKGIVNRDQHLLNEIVKKDEAAVNKYEIEIDELCTNLIAQYQPKAKNLRTILMILKMSSDLERMGDHAVNIVESGLYLIGKLSLEATVDIAKMSEITVKMFNDSINAFVNEDPALAKNVCERDNLVDDLKDKLVIQLSDLMASDPNLIKAALHLLRISGNLERIADLSTNICEDVLFMVQGRVIKHHQDETDSQA